ncbi:hypothetical protein M153_12570001518 [Pseudoloma neurophilia]|uniref:Uncharacterized protein n=1 Tax=Pseudoloma neurophilia TaxID=146866 RepID=A0A0R0LV12_9MICR|nr:hypothetical protein M153_12570001518 [Pseudoloma neurophilia]
MDQLELFEYKQLAAFIYLPPSPVELSIPIFLRHNPSVLIFVCVSVLFNSQVVYLSSTFLQIIIPGESLCLQRNPVGYFSLNLPYPIEIYSATLGSFSEGDTSLFLILTVFLPAVTTSSGSSSQIIFTNRFFSAKTTRLKKKYKINIFKKLENCFFITSNNRFIIDYL